MTILSAILPNGRTQFLDNSGQPVAGGSVGYYIPGGMVFKNTWQDPGNAVLNLNPIPLDAAGSALVWGAGEYRMILEDSTGAQLYDVLTYVDTPGTPDEGSGFGTQIAIVADTTTDLGTIPSHNALVTGGTTVAGFGDSASLDAPIWLCVVDTGFTAAASAGLVIPGGKDWVFAAGDSFLVEFLGTSQWQILAIWPGAGQSQGFGKQYALASVNPITDLGSITTNNALITGVADITGLGNSATLQRPIFQTVFAGVLTLSNSAALANITGEDIITAAGDSAVWEFLGASNWQMLSYTRQSGLPLTVTQVLQRTFVASANGGFDFTLPATVTPLTRIKFTLCAPGGGGGGTAAGNVGGGGGGGAGGYWQGVIYGFTGGQHITGSVGGVGGVGGTNSAGSAGNAVTKFTYATVDVVSCAVGAGGAKGNSGTPNAGGLGGAVTVDVAGLTLEATITNQSNPGIGGIYASSDVNFSGAGGSTPMGQGGPTTGFASGSAGYSGTSGTGYGAGGSGSVGATTVQAGNGSPGFFCMELLA